MFVVDTNVLIYAADTSFPEHEVCSAFLNECRTNSGTWHLTWGIIYEFMRVTTHPKAFRRPFAPELAWKFIQSLIYSPGLKILTETPRHKLFISDILNSSPPITGNLMFDARTAALMKEHGITRIYTRDADFHRFDFLTVIDPLR